MWSTMTVNIAFGWSPQSSITSMQNLLQYRPQSTKLFSTNDNSDDDFMKSLRNRMEEVSDRDTMVPIVVLDSMLPRQVLKIEADNEIFTSLVRTLVSEETPCFGMVGVAKLTSGKQVPLKHGVEVLIEGKPELVGTGLRLELRASRRFRIEGEVATSDRGWTEARVKFLDADTEEREEEDSGKGDRLSLARAMAKAREFTSPNINMEENKSLVERWVQLARENELQPGQIDQLLDDLGDIPDAEEPTDRALWVGALINPLPGMGVALEIRPALLSAKTAEERVEVALEGVRLSIKHMDGSERMF